MAIGVDSILLLQLIILTILITSVKPEYENTTHCRFDTSEFIDSNNYKYFCGKNFGEEQIVITVIKNAEMKNAEMKNIEMECFDHTGPDYIELITDMNKYLSKEKSKLTIKFCLFPNVPFVEILKAFDTKPITEFTFSHANTSTLKPYHLENLTSVEILSLEYNKFTTLPEGLFKDMSNLKELNLNGNKLRSLPNEIFDPLKNLITLNFYNNELTSIDGRIFQKLSSLQKLQLNNNKLDNLSNSTFNSLIELRTLEFISNGMTILNDGIFDNLKNLNTLNLNSNQLIRVPETPFVHNSKLSLIRLNSAFNKTNFQLPSKFFKGQESLKELYLESNDLTSLPKEIFQFDEENSLERLEIGYNLLSILDDDLFRNLKKLEILKINDNKLKIITQAVFQGLGALKTLDLSFNQLQNVEARLCENLKDVNLSHNLLTEVDEFWHESFNKLENLDISYNKLENLTEKEFTFNIPSSPTIDYSYNQITSINLTGIENFKIAKNKNKTIFRINDNPIKCDCHALTLAKYVGKNTSAIQIKGENVKCNEPEILKNQSLEKVDYKKLKCPLYEIHPELKNSCPESCDCNYRPIDQVLEVDCSYRKMKTFPKKIPVTDYDVELLFDGNYLTSVNEISDLHEKVRNRTIYLSLSNNKLESITGLEGLEKLKTLRLDNNLLTNLPNELDEYFKSLQKQADITLHGNPWSCDCDTKSLWLLIRNDLGHRILDKNDIRCPDNSFLIEQEQDDLCNRIIGYILMIGGLSIITLIFLLICVYIAWKNEIKVWMFAHKCLRWLVTEKEIDRDKIYDAFVSFCHVDQDFVDKHIIPNLEENNEENYKLCIHYRDFVVGEFIPEQIAYSVENSRRTIIVLSPDFLRSYWGQLEWRTAHLQAVKENCARVIVIMYKPVKTEDLDHELRAYITMNTYLEWGDNLFWRKLKYALGLPVDRLRRHIREVDMEPLRQLRIGS